jgi:hypothetical protein
MRTLTCDPSLELVGQTALAFFQNSEVDEIEPYLEKYHLDHMEPTQWYSATNFLAMLNEMAQHTNFTSSLVAVGIQVPMKMIVPPEMEKASLTDVLMGWDALYKMQHRGKGEMGYVKTEVVGPKHVKTTHHHIYPDDFTYGVAYGLAKRWSPKGVSFKVYYDPDVPRMDLGGDVTIIHVEWE